MSYKEAIDFLYNQLPMYQKTGKSAFKKDLTNIKALCKVLGQPQKGFRSIHIAGTNGKGTTSHLLSALFQAEGLTVGLYTSPHYKDFRERIKVNGEYISKKDVINFVNRIQTELQHIKASFFEITVAMAFEHFKQQQVDIAIIETGLGGRLDSTNIILPKLSVITNISLDHTDMLGDTLVKIAREKAGIIKKNKSVVIGESQREVMPVFKNKAHQVNSRLLLASSLSTVKCMVQNLTTSTYQIKLKNKNAINVTTSINGPFQSLNIRTAISSYIAYKNARSESINVKTIKHALLNFHSLTKYQGRWQIKRQVPVTILDSAHNESGIDFVIQQLNQHDPHRLHIILGFVKDKRWQALLQKFPSEAHFYFCQATIRRALHKDTLVQFAHSIGLNGRAYTSVKGAERAALRKAGPEDIVFIGGSTFVVAEAL